MTMQTVVELPRFILRAKSVMTEAELTAKLRESYGAK
jgi:hypothetical protein